MSRCRFPALRVIAPLLLWPLCAPLPAAAADDANLSLSTRLRVESVDDSRYPKAADAETLRLHAKANTSRVLGLQLTAGLELVDHFGSQRYDDTLNGRANHPTIADPDAIELDEAYVDWRPASRRHGLRLWAGRQWLMFGNQRFVGGGPGWRNNFQSYDGAGAELDPWAGAHLQASHVLHVHRPLGPDSPDGDEALRAELVQLDTLLGPGLSGSLYGFWIAFGDSHPFPQRMSSATQGASLAWTRPLSSASSLNLRGELAWQSGYADGAAGNDASYRQCSVGLAHRGWSAELGLEHLGGDGSDAFQTPLAALHFFNGHADRWLRTPGDGLDDFSASIGWRSSAAWAGIRLALNASHHRYRAARGGQDYGAEWDLMASATLGQDGRYGRLIAKLAAYAGAADAPTFARGDTRKLWLQWDWQPRLLAFR